MDDQCARHDHPKRVPDRATRHSNCANTVSIARSAAAMSSQMQIVGVATLRSRTTDLSGAMATVHPDRTMREVVALHSVAGAFDPMNLPRHS